MSDLISRQAAIDTLFELYEYQRDIDPTEAADLVRQGIYLAEKKIEQLPSADRPTGKWNPYYTKREHNHVFNCKLCGYTFIVLQGNDNMNFCPNCGVDMLNGQTVH
jgi:rubrerythrin